ncbi:uncharacterized protein HNP40_003191 [Mycobacteroides chelonae]|nr:uncharacterized protein [Mycobacteroides chelonae]
MAPSPREPGRRLAALDVLRGIAILGTLGSNIWIFTGVDRGQEPASHVAIAEFAGWFPNGKFLGLLTIMFGIGLTIQHRSASRMGKRWPGKYPIRCLLLFLDGILNYILVVQFDVLRAYAVVAFVVAFLMLFADRFQIWFAALFMAVHVGYMAMMSLQPWTSDSDAVSRRTLPTTAEVASIVDQTDPSQTSWWESVLINLEYFPEALKVNTEFTTVVFMAGALFLTGGLLYRHGLFEAHRRRLRYALMAVGFGLALPMDYAVSSLGTGRYDHWGRYFFAWGVSFGLLALVAEYAQRREFGWMGRTISVVGRMALSCYLLQNILGVVGSRIVFNQPWYTQMSYFVATTVAMASISTILIVFSWLWLHRFERGPAELLWHRMYVFLSRENTSTPGTSI